MIMLAFIVAFFVSFVAWILFTASFNQQEIIAGFFVSIITGALSRDLLFRKKVSSIFSPEREIQFIIYLMALFYAEITSHLDVLYRVITGKTNPAIIKVPTKMKSDWGKTLIGNSITMTPGTLTMKADKDLYVHCINFDKNKKVAGLFEKHGVGVTE